jgi:cytochrome-b5 reductase
VSVCQINYNTKLFRFGFASPEQRLDLPLASCIVTHAVINGEEVVRPYTPVSAPDQQAYLELVVKDYAAGKMSHHIHSLKPGDTLSFKGPFPKLQYKRNMHKHISMIAGGTGITPMLQVCPTSSRRRRRRSSSSRTDWMLNCR